MINKLVIPAAGYGTRFLPMTKASPKEMLPIIDKPVIQYVVEEAVASGITDIVIVTGYSKRAIEDHFDYSPELENYLEKSGKFDQLKEIRRIAGLANFIHVRQKGPYGNGTPVLNAETIIGNEPFAVMWGDEFIYSNPPRLRQMIDVYNKYGGVVISAVRIPKKENLSKYGIAKIKPVENNVFEIEEIIEKPEPDKAPSDMATHGAYILPPEIFKALRESAPGTGGEIVLAEAINKLRDNFKIYACEIKDGRYYDTGNKLEYLKANIEFGLEHPEIKEGIKEYLKALNLDK